MRYPAISPDGQTIAFTYKGDLYRVAASGGAATPLTQHPAEDFMPVWSHDGASIAFASDRHGNFDIYVMPAAGGEAKRLTFHSAAGAGVKIDEVIKDGPLDMAGMHVKPGTNEANYSDGHCY